MIALRDEWHLRIADINVLDDHLDAGVQGFLDHVFYRLRLAVAHDDSLYAKRNCLLDLLALKSSVLLALEDVQIHAESFGLPRDSRLVGLEIVALRKITDESDFDPALVKWRRRALDTIGERKASHRG